MKKGPRFIIQRVESCQECSFRTLNDSPRWIKIDNTCSHPNLPKNLHGKKCPKMPEGLVFNHCPLATCDQLIEFVENHVLKGTNDEIIYKLTVDDIFLGEELGDVELPEGGLTGDEIAYIRHKLDLPWSETLGEMIDEIVKNRVKE